MPTELRVFVSYRRADSAGHAGRLAEALGRRFGGHQVFQDLETIRAGQDYLHAIMDAVARADVVLVVIGPDWAGAPTGAAGSRLFQETDVVRREVAEALKLGKRVVPLLVGGAAIPPAESLPAEIRPLLTRNAFRLSDAGWTDDFERLCRELAGWPAGAGGERSLAVAWVVVGGATLLLALALDSWSAFGLTPWGAGLLLAVAAGLFGLGVKQAGRHGRAVRTAAWIGLGLCGVMAVVLL